MIAIDTNILVYAHRKDSDWHKPALKVLKDLCESEEPWALPFPCLHEFFAIVTHPKIFTPPSTREQAIEQMDEWLKSPSLVLLSEGHHYWSYLKKVLKSGRIIGPMIHDARIAALAIEAGATELWTADRDFSRFTIQTKNPLINN